MKIHAIGRLLLYRVSQQVLDMELLLKIMRQIEGRSTLLS